MRFAPELIIGKHSPFTFDVYMGEDGIPVVHVCTSGMAEDASGPVCRVYLNDAPIYTNPDIEED